MRALVVEPDLEWAQRIDAALKSEGILSEPAEVDEDAIDLVTHHDFDIVLLEFRLPDMSAPEVLRRLRAACIRTPVLILSDNDEAADKARCLTAGPTTILRNRITKASSSPASTPSCAAPRAIRSRYDLSHSSEA